MMSSPVQRGEIALRRIGKGIRASRKSAFAYSDFGEDKEDKNSNGPLGQRSVSLTVLSPGQPPVREPRMAQLETLEAKMASIEVSLCTTPRRKRIVSVGNLGVNGTVSPAPRARDFVRELETLKGALRDKDNTILSLKGQLVSSVNGRLQEAGGLPLSEQERRTAEERLHRLRSEMDHKRLSIKNLKLNFERLDITDNIDTRIEQAELEYQLGREELNLLTLLEESRHLQLCLEHSQNQNNGHASTIYRCVRGGGEATLHAVEIEYDPKSPRFGAGPREATPGLFVEWAAEGAGLHKGDRLLEVNGKIVLTRNKEEMNRLLTISPSPAQLVVIRVRPSPLAAEIIGLKHDASAAQQRAEEADRARDNARAENVRLTHRISYLEEQVAELLERYKNDKGESSVVSEETATTTCTTPETQNSVISSSCPNSISKSSIQVFQKGPQVTTLITHVPLVNENGGNIRNEKEERTHRLKTSRSINALDTAVAAAAGAVNELTEVSTRRKSHHHHHHHHTHLRRNHDTRSVRSEIEGNLHNTTTPTRENNILYRADARSVKSLDFDSEPISPRHHHHHNHHQLNRHQDHSNDYNSESITASRLSLPQTSRPAPPKKPIRMSLHKAASLQCVSSQTQPNSQPSLSQLTSTSSTSLSQNISVYRKPAKRKHKAEAPPAPVSNNNQGNNQHNSALRWPSTASSLHQAYNFVKNQTSKDKWC